MVAVDAAGDIEKESFQRAIADAEPLETSLPSPTTSRTSAKSSPSPQGKPRCVNAGPEEKRHLGAVGTTHPAGKDNVLVPGVVEKANPRKYSSLRAPYANEAKAVYAATFCSGESAPSTFMEATRAGAFFRSNVSTPPRIPGLVRPGRGRGW